MTPFNAIDWDVRQGIGGPGDNVWAPTNVEFKNGRVTLSITPPPSFNVRPNPLRARRNGWTCAEIISKTTNYGYGNYRFDVESQVDTLDKNIILGMFVYFPENRTQSVPPNIHPLVQDGTQEITVEIARWGNTARSATNGNFTVFPAIDTRANLFESDRFVIKTAKATRYIFDWQQKSVHFKCIEGRTVIRDWLFAPPDPLENVPTPPMQVHINLWLRANGTQLFYPTTQAKVSVTLSNFAYT